MEVFLPGDHWWTIMIIVIMFIARIGIRTEHEKDDDDYDAR